MSDIEKSEVEALARDLDAIMQELRKRAYSGDKKAIHEIWRTGVNAAKGLDAMTSQEKPKVEILKMAKTKMDWPFSISPIHEHNKGNTKSNSEAYAEWLGLGKGKGIILKKAGKGGSRNLRPETESGFALRVRNQIEEDLKTYGGRSDAEILGGFYRTWKCRHDLKPDPETRKNKKRLLKYVKQIRAITDIRDQKQWMEAVKLWVMVYSEGNPEAPDIWPERAYRRAEKRGTVSKAVVEMIEEGLWKVIEPMPAKKLLPCDVSLKR